MSNNTPDYEDNLAFEPAKTAGTMATIARDGKAVAIRCYIDNQHYFDLLEMVARGITLGCDTEDVIRITSAVKRFCISKRESERR